MNQLSPNVTSDSQTNTVTSSRSKEFFSGASATFPLLVGAAPFGIIFGTLAEPNGLSALGAILMSVIVFAGASQFIALSLLAAGASVPIIIATTFIVNFRHILYSANLVSKVKHLPQYWRAIMAFGLTDETFAAVNNRYLTQGNLHNAHWYYLGSFLSMYSNWILCTYIGLTLGNIFPEMQNWGLDFAMSVTFLGMVVPYLKSKPILVAVLVSAVLAVVSYDFPHKLGLLFASFAGISVGVSLMMLQNRSKKSQQESEK